MFKEIIVAIIIGGILGLGITGGYLTMQRKDQPTNKNNSVITEPTLIPTSTNQQPNNQEKDNSITITSPENNALISTSKTTISGTTTPNSNIIIATTSETFTGKKNETKNIRIFIYILAVE
jgi:hypothetical protein